MGMYDDYSFEACTWVDEHNIVWMKEALEWKDFLRTRLRLHQSHLTAKEYLHAYPQDFAWGEFCLRYGQVSRAEGYKTVRDRIKKEDFLYEGQCYQNSIRTLRSWKEDPPSWIQGKKVSYVEGLALDQTGIFLHGWIDVDGIAHDVTFQRAWMTTYFGVRFDLAWADSTMERIKHYGLFHWWERSQPLLEQLKHDV